MKFMLAAVAALTVSNAAFAQADHDMGKMPAMDPTAAVAGAQGSGVIKKLDPKGGSVTLQHGPIAALRWPAMTMTFKAAPAILTGLKVGQAVSFTVKAGGAPEVVAITAK